MGPCRAAPCVTTHSEASLWPRQEGRGTHSSPFPLGCQLRAERLRDRRQPGKGRAVVLAGVPLAGQPHHAPRLLLQSGPKGLCTGPGHAEQQGSDSECPEPILHAQSSPCPEQWARLHHGQEAQQDRSHC